VCQIDAETSIQPSTQPVFLEVTHNESSPPEYPAMKVLTALVAIALPLQAFAHLTWIDAGKTSLGLSTGHNFPAKEITVKGEYVESIQCIGDNAVAFNLQFDDQSIRYAYPETTQNCVARLKTSQIELSPAQGVAHLEENKAGKLLIEKARASPSFSEKYFKLSQMRPVEIGSPLYNPDVAQFVHRPGDAKHIYVYRNGMPLPGLSIGLEYPETPITLWSTTNAEGKVTLLLQPKSKALLRTLISQTTDTGFESQFLSVTLNPQ
jgi:hypothetical protein